MAGFRTTGTRNVADVGFTRLDEVTIEAPDGSTAIRFVLRMHQAVAVVPLDGDEVVLIEQYRTPFGESLLEIPAGVLDIPPGSQLNGTDYTREGPFFCFGIP